MPSSITRLTLRPSREPTNQPYVSFFACCIGSQLLRRALRCGFQIEYEENFADGPIKERPQGKRIPISQQSARLLSNSESAAFAAAQAAGGKATRDICFVVHEPPFSVITTVPDPFSETIKMGVSRVVWSFDSTFVATKSDQMPHNVWIWQMDTMKLHSVVQLIQPVRSFRWDPITSRLALCSGESRVHLWTPEGVSWIDIPVGTCVRSPN